MTSRPLTAPRAGTLVAALDLGLDESAACRACLSFVSLAMDFGDASDIARELRRMTPDLWEDGLAQEALGAVRRACELGIPDGEAALSDLEQRGGRSVVAREIVRLLAAELSRRVHTGTRVGELARDRLSRPELN